MASVELNCGLEEVKVKLDAYKSLFMSGKDDKKVDGEFIQRLIYY